MNFPQAIKLRMVACLFPFLGHSLCAQSESSEIDENIIDLAPFVIHAGEIDVIDGITGEVFSADNKVVWGFADSFKQYLLEYHEQLLKYEIQHMNYRMMDGTLFVKELAELAESFGIRHFDVNSDWWMRIEKAILHRLNTKPFFRIKALIVWDLDRLNKMKPAMPDTKYARDIRFNEATETWERRVTTEWVVEYSHPRQGNWPPMSIYVKKKQGLNLDTNEGYHFINRPLTGQVYPGAFEEVEITYPIFYSSRKPAVDQIKRLQETYEENLFHIYDPFSWAARRNLRFRGGFSRDLLKHFESQSFRINDRDWFNPVLCNLLSDVITIKRHGLIEIYSLYTAQRFQLSGDLLGNGLDLLNWHPGEKREGKDRGANAKIWINFDNPDGARFIVLDAYMRYREKFLSALREKLTTLKRKTSGREIIEQTIQEVSGVPFDVYLKNAIQAQKEMITKNK